MFMKRPVCLTLVIAGALCVNAQVRPNESEWKATLKVVDDTGQPVSGAEMRIGYAIPPAEGQDRDWVEITGVTDTNGVFTASHRDRSVYLSFQARKSGYYPCGIQHDVGFAPEDHSER